MYRVILRFSLNGDNTPATTLRNAIGKLCDQHGLSKGEKTSTWESGNINIQQASVLLGDLLTKVHNASQSAKVNLDHLWAYIDKVDEENQD